MQRSHFKRILIGLIALVILVSMGIALREQWDTLAPHWEQLSMGSLAIIFVHALIYRVVNASAWAFIVRALHWNIGIVRGLTLWLVSESCRWLPGSVWSMFSRVHLASKEGLSLTAASITVNVELFLTLLAWGLCAAIGIIWSGSYHVITPYLSQLRWIIPAILIGTIVLITGIFMVRRILQRGGSWADKIKKLLNHLQEAYHRRPRYGMLGGILVFYLTLCLYNGYIFWLILQALGLEISIADACLANALGWVLGFLAIMAPGGIGVREAVIVALLAGNAPVQALALAAVIWRLIQVASELACLIPWCCQKLVSLLKRSHSS